MRWILLMLVCAVLSTNAEPEPKKYNPETKDKEINTSLTDEERKFIREVESKFGVKSDITGKEESKEDSSKDEQKPVFKAPFPAVIAIEIVNDTDTKSKGKRTIDANLGYGYQTNNGYTYTYLPRTEEKGKFMIYPYSQEDIPPPRHTDYEGHGHHHVNPHLTEDQSSSTNSATFKATVEITPSQAYELVPIKQGETKQVSTEESSEETDGYRYEMPSSEKYTSIETPPPPAVQPPVLYTTYNGQQFSGLSGQFPAVSQKYYVDPAQLVNIPQYQSAGLTQDYLRSQGSLEQRVVPVLVLRIPSSYLKDPSAELYANLPQNYPLSQYLNNINLQDVVNEYFKKIGYSFAPQIMAYQSSALEGAMPEPAPAPVQSYAPQQYASPYVRPAYTQADYSGGVQYSAVQPVMAKYPSNYQTQYYSQASQSQPQQQYTYQYQYESPASAQEQSYQRTQYQPQFQYLYQYSTPAPSQSSQEHSQEVSSPEQPEQQTHYHQDTVTINTDSDSNSLSTHDHVPDTVSEEHTSENCVSQTNHEEHTETEYTSPKQEVRPVFVTQSTPAPDVGPTRVAITVYSTPRPKFAYASTKDYNKQYAYFKPAPAPAVQKETVAVSYPLPVRTLSPLPSIPSSHLSHGSYSSQVIHPPVQFVQKYRMNTESAPSRDYLYQNHVDTGSHSAVVSENYPSKDHTIATVLPFSFKPVRPSHHAAVQAVSYVTPSPSNTRYHSQYKIMAPQPVLRGSNSAKISYVDSHSMPNHFVPVGSASAVYTNPGYDYSPGTRYIAETQKFYVYPRNHHAHPKRHAKADFSNKSEVVSSKMDDNDDSNKKRKDGNAKPRYTRSE